MSDAVTEISDVIGNLAERVKQLEAAEVPTVGGGGIAPANAEYVTMALDPTLTAERVLTEGPDIDIVDSGANAPVTVGRGGDTVLLFDSGGNPVAEYAATAAGLAAAIAAATTGDVVQLPAIPIVGNITISANCTIVGMGEFGAPTAGVLGKVSITAGLVKLFGVAISVSDGTAALDITAATVYLDGCDITNSGSGRAIYIHSASATVHTENCTFYQSSSSTLPCAENSCSSGTGANLNEWTGQVIVVANTSAYAVKTTGGLLFLKDTRIQNLGAGGDLQRTGGTLYVEDVQYDHAKTNGTILAAPGDRSAWDVSSDTVDDLHASDIEADFYLRHLPLPGADGATVVSAGGEWTRIAGGAAAIALGAFARYASNPIIVLGGAGAWDDTDILNPSVVKVSDSEYHIFYSGYHATHWQTGHATSADGKTWAKDGANPVIPYGIGWEALSSTDGTTVKFGGTWYHYYAGESAGHVWKIGVATASSLNGPWAKNPGNPILTAAGGWEGTNIADPFAFVLDNRIYLLYAGGIAGAQQIGLAWSDDGINFTRYGGNPVVVLGAAGAWDDSGVAEPSLTRIGQYFYLWYTGSDGANRVIGMAYSSDLVTWTKYSGNPVLSSGAGWDAGDVCDQEVLLENGELVMFYGGGTLHNPVNINGQIGRATVVFPNVYIDIETGTGLTGGPITSVGKIALADTAVVPGAYTLAGITVDQQGRITAASSGAATDEKVKVSATDTTADYLLPKLVAGTNVTLTQNNIAGNETITVAAPGGSDHLHGLARWVAGGGTTFDLPDTAEYLEWVTINGLLNDQLTVSLASGNTQLVFDVAPVATDIIQAEYVIRRI